MTCERTLTQLIRAAPPLNNLADVATDVPIADWAALAACARQHGLAPLLMAALKARGRMDEPPAAVVENLRMACTHTHVANWLAYQELGRLLELFDREQIPLVLLKGCALAVTLYPDVNLRPMGDLDLLIPRAAAARGIVLLTEQGYSSLPELTDGFQQRFSNEQALYRGGQRPSQVDLHWHVLGLPYYRARIPVEWFWERTTEVSVNSQKAQILSPTAQFVHLALHFALQHRSTRLLWSYDLALLLARYRDEIRWDEVADVAHAFGLSQALQTALAHVADTWSVSVPADARAQLSGFRVSIGDRISFAVATAQQTNARLLLDGLSMPGVRAKFVYVLRHGFPGLEFMQTRYHVPHMVLMPLYYLWRSCAGAYKIARSALSIAMNIIGVFRNRQHV